MLRKGEPYIELTFKVVPEDGAYAAHCMELGVSSCGSTIDEAKDNIAEAVDVHLETLSAIGDLHRFLREKGVPVKAFKPPKRSLPRREIRVALDEWAQRSRVPVPH